MFALEVVEDYLKQLIGKHCDGVSVSRLDSLRRRILFGLVDPYRQGDRTAEFAMRKELDHAEVEANG